MSRLLTLAFKGYLLKATLRARAKHRNLLLGLYRNELQYEILGKKPATTSGTNGACISYVAEQPIDRTEQAC